MLPKEMVIKWNNDSGGVVIIKDKTTINKDNLIKRLIQLQNRKHWYKYYELFYMRIKKQVLIEKFISSNGESLPIDYKFYCFNGYCDAVMVCKGRTCFEKPKYYLFDKDWNLMCVTPDSINEPSDFTLKRPERLIEM